MILNNDHELANIIYKFEHFSEQLIFLESWKPIVSYEDYDRMLAICPELPLNCIYNIITFMYNSFTLLLSAIWPLCPTIAKYDFIDSIFKH